MTEGILHLVVEIPADLEVADHLLVGDAESLPLPPLHHVHGLFGPSDQFVRGDVGIVDDRGPDAGLHPDLEFTQHEGVIQCPGDSLKEGGDARLDLDPAGEQDKLVAAESPEHVVTPADRHETRGNFLEQAVPGLVPEVVIHILESVHVEEEDDRVGFQSVALQNGLLDRTENDGAVGGSGELIVGRLVP